MQIHFSKMHGLGNDFVVIEKITQSIDLTVENIIFLANRRFGIGCDQLLLVEPGTQADIDFVYRIFNADGNEVEQCGNGARCFARFVVDKKLINKDIISVQTKSGILKLQLQTDGEVTVNMGIPEFLPQKVPFEAKTQSSSYNLDIAGKKIKLSVVAIGNPHAIIEVDDIEKAPVETLGAEIERHQRFPNRVNAGFMQIVHKQEISLRVYERGVGETLACGSGACAAVVAGIMLKKLDNQVSVRLRGGRLKINWAGAGSAVMMTGPATSVYEGHIEI